jgi:UDP-glucose 4-epimerase
MQNKILVTGGAGYIGSITVRELVKQKYDVVVLDSLESGNKEAVDPQAKLEVCDLEDRGAVAEVFEKYNPEAVIDFAAYLAVGESMENPEKYIQNNVVNFVNLLDVMAEKKCKYIIKSSTAAAYGNPLDEKVDIPLKEDYLERYKPEKSCLLPGKWNEKDTEGEEFLQIFLNRYDEIFSARSELKLTNEEITKLRIPMSIYGLTKLLDEILMRKYDELHGIKYIALRYFNVCGADPSGEIGEAKSKPTTLMTVVIDQILGKVEIVNILGRDYPTPDGTGIRDYIHPCDLSTGHLDALEYLIKNNKSDAFNLGTGKGSSVLEVIDAVEQASGKKVKTADAPRRSGDPVISVSDPSKANEVLGWKARYNLTDMAETAWKWHSNHPKGYGETE